MPLARGTGGGGWPGVTPGTGVVIPAAMPEIGVYAAYWHAPDGTVLELTPPSGYLTDTTGGSLGEFMSLKNVAGIGASPVDLVTSPAPDGGVVVEFTRPKERLITWPVRMRGDTHLQLVGLWRYVTELITMTRRLGPGHLEIVRPDGDRRWIPCHYLQGLDQEPEDGAWRQVTANVGLLCPDPFWQDVNPTPREWAQESPPDYLNPYPSFGSGQVIGAASMRNDGVVDAWPSWTIQGPLTSLVATNVTRGESFTLTYTLTAGQQLTMSTRPIQVRGPAGVQAVSALNLLAGGVPWRLDPKATTSIQFTAAGSAAETTPGARDRTLIKMAFVQKHETA